MKCWLNTSIIKYTLFFNIIFHKQNSSKIHIGIFRVKKVSSPFYSEPYDSYPAALAAVACGTWQGVCHDDTNSSYMLCHNFHFSKPRGSSQ